MNHDKIFCRVLGTSFLLFADRGLVGFCALTEQISGRKDH